MIDPIVSAAFSIFSNKGAYALFLGSGVSTAAGIPTGWAVVEDLIRKVAVASGENPPSDPVAWYSHKFGEQPGYSQLLDRLGATAEERLNILQGYFVPTPEEREQGLKQPTNAHKAIAELVASGYFRVILTTNFDPLVETAIAAAGVVPTVLSTPDAIQGTLPIQHQPCTILKINGDYRDLRIKNTVDELSEYDPRTERLLDRILDEYGLLICGWSAQWDIALVKVFQRAVAHRFNTFWTVRDPLSASAQELATLRRATIVNITDADTFFRSVAKKIRSLEQFSQPHPFSQTLAIAALKRYIVDVRHRVALRDLVHEEVERVQAEVNREDLFPKELGADHYADIRRRVEAFEVIAGTLVRIIAVGCYYGETNNHSLWADVLDRLASVPMLGGNVALLKLRRYVGLLAMYAGGLAALAAGKVGTVRSLLTTSIHDEGTEVPLVTKVYPAAVLDRDIANKAFYAPQNRHTPVSDRIATTLREPMREFLPRDERYEAIFDEFEYLIGFKYMDLKGGDGWCPIGRWGWHDSGRKTLDGLVHASTAQAENWPPVRENIFESTERFLQLDKAMRENILPRLNFW